jgi:hypothetical protein
MADFLTQREIISKGAELMETVIEKASPAELSSILSRAEAVYQPRDRESFLNSLFVKHVSAVLEVDLYKEYGTSNGHELYCRLHFLLTAYHVEIKAHNRLRRELADFENCMVPESKSIEKKLAKGN